MFGRALASTDRNRLGVWLIAMSSVVAIVLPMADRSFAASPTTDTVLSGGESWTFQMAEPSTAPVATPSSVGIELLAAPGSLFGATTIAFDARDGVLAIVRRYSVRTASGYTTDPPTIGLLEIRVPGERPTHRVRVSDQTTSVALGPGARNVVVGSREDLQIVDVESGSVLARVPIAVSELAVDTDGTIAASIGGGVVLVSPDGTEQSRHTLAGTARGVMRIYTGEFGPTYHETLAIEGEASPSALAFDEGGRLAVGMTDGSVRVIDGSSVVRIDADDPGAPFEAYPHVVTPYAVHWSDGRVLALSGRGVILSYDPATAGPADVVAEPDCEPDEVETLLDMFGGDRSTFAVSTYCEDTIGGSFAPGGHRLAQVGRNGVRIRSTEDGAGIAVWVTLDHQASDWIDDDRLVLGNVDGAVRVVDATTGAVLEELSSAGASGSVEVYPRIDLVVTRNTFDTSIDGPPTWVAKAFHFDGRPRALELASPWYAVAAGTERVVAVDRETGALDLVDLEGNRVASLPAIPVDAEYYALGIAADGRSVGWAADGVLTVVTEDGNAQLITDQGDVVERIALSDDGARVAVSRYLTAEDRHKLEVYDVATGDLIFDSRTRGSFALSSDGADVAYGDVGGDKLVFRSVDEGEPVHTPLREPLRAVQIGPDGVLVFALATEGLEQWDRVTPPISMSLDILDPDAIRRTSEVVVVEDGEFGTHVLRAADMAHLVSVYALVDGGFAVIAPNGAIDGSASMVDGLIAVDHSTGSVADVDEAMLDRVRVPNLLGLALSGETVSDSP